MPSKSTYSSKKDSDLASQSGISVGSINDPSIALLLYSATLLFLLKNLYSIFLFFVSLAVKELRKLTTISLYLLDPVSAERFPLSY
jgi:hypothetical protein